MSDLIVRAFTGQAQARTMEGDTAGGEGTKLNGTGSSLVSLSSACVGHVANLLDLKMF